MFHMSARLRRSGGFRGARGRVLEQDKTRQDTIPKPDGLAWPESGPSSNQNRTQPARCPALFEPGPAIVRRASGVAGQVKNARRCCAAGEVVTRHPHGVAVERPVFASVNMNRLSELAEARLRVFTCANTGQATRRRP